MRCTVLDQRLHYKSNIVKAAEWNEITIAAFICFSETALFCGFFVITMHVRAPWPARGRDLPFA